jgi:hypothetical protein
MRLLFIFFIFSFKVIFSFSQASNSDSLLKNFKGYKVPSNVKNLGANYWKRNTPVMKDLIIQTFQKPLSFAEIANQQNCIQAGWGGSTCGDFNNDGWIDVFTPGGIDSSSYKDRNRGTGFSFLLWDSTNKVFKDTNLIKDKSIEVLMSAMKATPVYLNSDNYIDIVIFPGDDSYAPLKLILSNGKGEYEYSEIITNENDVFPAGTPNGKPTVYKGSGDIEDLNGDGYPDIYISANQFAYILWGIPDYPYFESKNHPFFVQDLNNFPTMSNNGFGEDCTSCANSFGGVIEDVNKDGKNDLIVFGANPTEDKIIINQGLGRFNDRNVINIPRYIPQGDGGDYLLIDLNGDGLKDFVTVTGGGLNGKKSYNNIYAEIQRPDHTFFYDTSIIQFSPSFKTRLLGGSGGSGTHLFNYDFNNDGKMDIGYINSAWGDDCGLYDSLNNRGNILPYKTVFINENNKFIERDYYQYDLYAKATLASLKKRFICKPINLIKPQFNTTNLNFCSNDSLKLSITNINKGDKLNWYFGGNVDTLNKATKYFSDNFSIYVTRTDSLGCVISSDTILIKKYIAPTAPIIQRDTANYLLSGVSGTTWYKDGQKIADTTQKIKPTSNGNYTATTTQNGCTSSASANYYYITSAVANLSGDEYFKVSPNPTNGEILINYNIRSTKDVYINVIAMSGRTIINNKRVNNGAKLNLGSSMKGNYILQVKDKAGRLLTTEKLIKN